MRAGPRYLYVPPSVNAAEKHMKAALSGRIESLPKREFLRAYCSLVYLYPGFHPDCWEDWDGPRDFASLIDEAGRRADAGLLTENELYPYTAAKARVASIRREAKRQGAA